jgi:(S)-ureidoglycine aminohydrolase
VKSYFERPTAMCRRFEMHVTTLKEGLKSHDPHTHRAEEIIVVISNETQMQIGSNFYKAKAGDIYYLGSNILHGIQNAGKGNCSYFAFQFE